MTPTEFTPRGSMTKAQADAIQKLYRVFAFRGLWMECRDCRRALPITMDGLFIEHRPDCLHAGEQHPWARLRAILNARQEGQ
jgi:hypothetical protein